MESGEIICDTRAELDAEVKRICNALNSLIPGETVTSGYILYAINGYSPESTFQYEVAMSHKNPPKIAFKWKTFKPCDIGRCIPDCGFCHKNDNQPTQTYCNCSWGREYFRWTFWIATIEEVAYDQDGNNDCDTDNPNRGIL
jgi:hypothetical protein